MRPCSCGVPRVPNWPLEGDWHDYSTLKFTPMSSVPLFASEIGRVSAPSVSSMRRFMSPEELWPEGFDARIVRGGKPAALELWVDDVHTASHGPTAIVTGMWFFGQRDSAPDEVQRGPFTFVYVLKGAEYRLAHLNFGKYLETRDGEDG